MIDYFLTGEPPYALDALLRGLGRRLAPRLRITHYDHLFAGRIEAPAVAIFTEHDRLTSAELEQASAWWDRFAAQGTRLLNNPSRLLLRFDLLRTLCAEGINDFDVYAAGQAEPRRWPVFLRNGNDHYGPRSDLLHTAAELKAALEELRVRGVLGADAIVTEYLDFSDGKRLFHKYGAFVVGEQIIPRHLMIARKWSVKANDAILDPGFIKAELEYLHTNPHAEELRRIARLAHIEYGRIDYGFHQGRLQVFEINTNPIPILRRRVRRSPRRAVYEAFAAQFVAALEALDPGGGAEPRWKTLLPWRQRRLRERRLPLRHA